MLSALTGCSNKNEGDSAKFDTAREINVLTREDGSGTRGAFIELFGIEQKNEAGEKIDYTADTAAVSKFYVCYDDNGCRGFILYRIYFSWLHE